MFVMHVRMRASCVCVRHLRQKNLCDIFDEKTYTHTHTRICNFEGAIMCEWKATIRFYRVKNWSKYTYLFNVFIQKRIFSLSPSSSSVFASSSAPVDNFSGFQMGMPNHWIHICASQCDCMCATAPPYYLIRHGADLWDKYRIVMTMLSVALWFVAEKKYIYNVVQG